MNDLLLQSVILQKCVRKHRSRLNYSLEMFSAYLKSKFNEIILNNETQLSVFCTMTDFAAVFLTGMRIDDRSF